MKSELNTYVVSSSKYIDTYDMHWYLVLLTNFAPYILLHMLSKERKNVKGRSMSSSRVAGKWEPVYVT